MEKVYKHASEDLTVKVDEIQNLGTFVAVLGKERAAVGALGTKLGLAGSYVARSYIEQVQLEKLTTEFASVSEDWKRRFAEGGDVQMLDDLMNSHSPPLRRIQR
eukprot:gene4315-14426_t